jgi:hypothetical protein
MNNLELQDAIGGRDRAAASISSSGARKRAGQEAA